MFRNVKREFLAHKKLDHLVIDPKLHLRHLVYAVYVPPGTFDHRFALQIRNGKQILVEIGMCHGL
jgi:hypothetical protein